MSDFTRVLFVCMGNICRSPTAHAVMQHKLEQRKLTRQIKVDSAGTHAFHTGEPSDPRSREYAASRGVDMESIRSRKITEADFNDFDFILGMDHDNMELIRYYAPAEHRAEINLFLAYANQLGEVAENVVPDPYYGGADGFRHVFELVEQGCDSLLSHILND